ncbi:MAG: 4-(cytidine 5'-diphospho)-2-C-methyl-D-erythritol kinase, partial [Desulfarculaceae bacterium]
MQITLTAPAKVNLCLKVAGKRLDGYHQVVTLMQPLSIGDRLTVGIDGQGLAFTCSDQSLQNEDNLVLRAARLWFDEAGVKARASFHLQKQLPVAAGLGGGSSDAAATLLGLNVLHGGILTPQRLHSLAAALGSDVPFFLGGVTAFC